MTANAISKFVPFALADAAKQACDEAMQTFVTQLQPQLTSLTDEERAVLPRISANVDEFCDKGLTYGRSHPDLLPASVDIDEMQNDTDAIVILTPYLQSLKVTVKMIEDKIDCARAGRLARSSAFYASTKIGAKLNHPGAATIRDDMAQAYAKYGRRKKVTTPPPAPAPDKE